MHKGATMNRLPRDFFASPTIGDKLIAGAYGARLELLRCTGEARPQPSIPCQLQNLKRL